LKVPDEGLPKFIPRANAIWGKIVEPCPCVVLQMQRYQLKGGTSRSAANGDGGDEVIEPNLRVLLPIELDYTVAEFYSFRQRCGAN
jgi:hypothetical protein